MLDEELAFPTGVTFVPPEPWQRAVSAIEDEAARDGLMALRAAMLDASRFHDAWVTRGMTCTGGHAVGEALCQNVTAVNYDLLSEVPQ